LCSAFVGAHRHSFAEIAKGPSGVSETRLKLGSGFNSWSPLNDPFETLVEFEVDLRKRQSINIFYDGWQTVGVDLPIIDVLKIIAHAPITIRRSLLRKGSVASPAFKRLDEKAQQGGCYVKGNPPRLYATDRDGHRRSCRLILALFIKGCRGE